MRKPCLLLAIVFSIIWISCNRSNDSILNNPPDTLLVKTIQKDTTGRIMNVVYYSKWGVISDSGFSATGELASHRKFEYNAKGMRTYYHWYLPIFFKGGNHWAGRFYYDNDTVLRMTESFTDEKLMSIMYRSSNTAGQPLEDSTVQTSGTSALIRYQYDALGRLSRLIKLSPLRDTTQFLIYIYTANTVEEQESGSASAYPVRPTSKTIRHYRDDGKILSEIIINSAGQLASEITYTYDAEGRLTLKKSVSAALTREESNIYDANGWLTKSTDISGSSKYEQLYTNNSFGKPEKMERYSNEKLVSTMFYYYE